MTKTRESIIFDAMSASRTRDELVKQVSENLEERYPGDSTLARAIFAEARVAAEDWPRTEVDVWNLLESSLERYKRERSAIHHAMEKGRRAAANARLNPAAPLDDVQLLERTFEGLAKKSQRLPLGTRAWIFLRIFWAKFKSLIPTRR